MAAMQKKVEETKLMFKVVAANPRLDAKQKKSYYNMLRDLISMRPSPYENIMVAGKVVDTMQMSQVLQHREYLATLMKGGKANEFAPYRGWKKPLSWIEGLLIMGGWMEKPAPIQKIKPSKARQLIQEFVDVNDGNNVVIDVAKLAEHLGLAKIGQISFKL